MKGIITITVLLIFVHITGFAQSFVSESKLWSVVSRDASGYNMWTRTSMFKFMGDSTLNDILYNKLYYSADNGGSWGFNSLWYEKNDSVFQYYPLDETNTLIYDFNLQERDTFYLRYNEYLYVDSVRTQLWGKRKYKIIYLSADTFTFMYTKWIQGVGQDGMIIRSTEIGVFGGISSMLCFHENGEQIYQNPDYNTCYINITSAVNTLENKTKLIEVLAFDIGLLTIRMPNNQQGVFTLYTLEGKQLFSQSINTTETQICVSASGLVIYQFTSINGEIQRGKLIVR